MGKKKVKIKRNAPFDEKRIKKESKKLKKAAKKHKKTLDIEPKTQFLIHVEPKLQHIPKKIIKKYKKTHVILEQIKRYMLIVLLQPKRDLNHTILMQKHEKVLTELLEKEVIPKHTVFMRTQEKHIIETERNSVLSEINEKVYECTKAAHQTFKEKLAGINVGEGMQQNWEGLAETLEHYIERILTPPPAPVEKKKKKKKKETTSKKQKKKKNEPEPVKIPTLEEQLVEKGITKANLHAWIQRELRRLIDKPYEGLVHQYQQESKEKAKNAKPKAPKEVPSIDIKTQFDIHLKQRLIQLEALQHYQQQYSDEKLENLKLVFGPQKLKDDDQEEKEREEENEEENQEACPIDEQVEKLIKQKQEETNNVLETINAEEKQALLRAQEEAEQKAAAEAAQNNEESQEENSQKDDGAEEEETEQGNSTEEKQMNHETIREIVYEILPPIKTCLEIDITDRIRHHYGIEWNRIADIIANYEQDYEIDRATAQRTVEREHQTHLRLLEEFLASYPDV